MCVKHDNCHIYITHMALVIERSGAGAAIEEKEQEYEK